MFEKRLAEKISDVKAGGAKASPGEAERWMSTWRRAMVSKAGQWVTLHTIWWSLTIGFLWTWSVLVLSNGSINRTWWAVTVDIVAFLVIGGAMCWILPFWCFSLPAKSKEGNNPLRLKSKLLQDRVSRPVGLLLDAAASSGRKAVEANGSLTTRLQVRKSLKDMRSLAVSEKRALEALARTKKAVVSPEDLAVVRARQEALLSDVASVALLLEDLAAAEIEARIQKDARKEVAAAQQAGSPVRTDRIRILQEQVNSRRSFVDAESEVTGVKPAWK